MFDVYSSKDGTLIKKDCTLIAIIPAGLHLTDDQVREYYNIDNDHRYWESFHNPFKVPRYVFDRLVAPITACKLVLSDNEEN